MLPTKQVISESAFCVTLNTIVCNAQPCTGTVRTCHYSPYVDVAGCHRLKLERIRSIFNPVRIVSTHAVSVRLAPASCAVHNTSFANHSSRSFFWNATTTVWQKYHRRNDHRLTKWPPLHKSMTTADFEQIWDRSEESIGISQLGIELRWTIDTVSWQIDFGRCDCLCAYSAGVLCVTRTELNAIQSVNMSSA